MSSHARLTRSGAMLATALGAVVMVTSLVPAIVFAATPVTHYLIFPSPIAAPGSLAANSTKTIDVQAKSAKPALVPGAVVYLSFSAAAGGGSASVGTTALTTTPKPFTSTTGKIFVTYRTPSVLPGGGRDTLKAANAKTGATITATDSYLFSAVSKYTFNGNPIAPPGSLAASSGTSVTLTALDASSVAVPGAVVLLSYFQGAGGGTASVGSTALTGTRAAFTANVSGQIVITYTAPASLPASGTDTISATDSTKNATITRTDSYSFAGPTSFTISPAPIAATNTLTASQTVSLTLTARDSGSNSVPGALVWVSFTQAANGGSASVGAKVLSATPARFLTSASGTLTITYTASATHPSSGTDTINAENLKVGPTITVSDAYTY